MADPASTVQQLATKRFLPGTSGDRVTFQHHGQCPKSKKIFKYFTIHLIKISLKICRPININKHMETNGKLICREMIKNFMLNHNFYLLYNYTFMIVASFLHALFLNQDGVTIGLEVLLPKEAKRHPETSQPLQYDVFLYKYTNNGDSTSPSQILAPVNSYTSSQHISKSPKPPKSPKMSKSPKLPKNTKEYRLANHEPLSAKRSSPNRQSSAARHPSPIRHSAPEFFSSSTCHLPSHHSQSQYKCMPKSASTPPQIRLPRGRSRASDSREHNSRHIHPSPSSPHLTQPPPSPSAAGKYSPVSTRSLPPLS